jgi:hypothetical protein
MRPSFASIAAAALTIAASPLAAQNTSALPTGSARVVAAYDFWNGSKDATFPRSVTVSDSAGTIIARVQLANEGRSVPMQVTVIESNLVLQGETPDGILTLVLDRQNEGGDIKLATGTWTLGNASGQLRRRGEK